MRKITGKKYGTERVRVDDIAFENCVFDGTTLVFGGGTMPTFGGSALNGIDFDFDGPAFETIKLLRQLVLMGGRDFVRDFFELADRAKP